MANEDFIINNDVLEKYNGTDTDVSIPDGVTRIKNGAFSHTDVQTVTIPDSVTTLDRGAFYYCRELKKIILGNGIETIKGYTVSDCFMLTEIIFGNSIRTIESNAFSNVLSYPFRIASFVFPASLQKIEHDVFRNTTKYIELHSSELELPKEKKAIFINKDVDLQNLIIFAPNLPFKTFADHGLGISASLGFISHSKEYSETAMPEEYIRFIASQKKKFLPYVYKNDAVEILMMLANTKKITEKNIKDDFLSGAVNGKAEKCINYLNELADTFGMGKAKVIDKNALWDGKHFSLDGKKLLLFEEENDQTEYFVPEGTKEICSHSFQNPELTTIRLPESVTTIRNDAFSLHRNTLIWLPDSLKSVPKEFVMKYSTCSVYLVTSCASVADKTGGTSLGLGDNRGRIYPVYTGGEIDDLLPKVKTYAVQGFLYVSEHHIADMSKWRNGYLEYIKKNSKTYVKQCVENDYLLQLMIDEKLLSVKDTDFLLSEDRIHKQTDVYAKVLTYKNKYYADNQTNKLSLSDDDRDLRKMLEMDARHEKIKNHNGIKGITFVVTGYMDNFGVGDEYTNAKDWSDLKSYIEERGGYLRGSVSSKTDYLICNDPDSTTSKAKKARELGIPFITEEEFMKITKQ